MSVSSTPDDARFGELYGLSNPEDADLNAPEAWDRVFGAGSFPRTGVRVGIVDICKALDAQGSGPTSGIANCIDYLAGKNVKVISMSLGGGASTTTEQAVQRAWNGGNGAVVAAAAGNSGDSSVSYPAGYADAVSVAATAADDAKASFSQFNERQRLDAGVDDLGAPGRDPQFGFGRVDLVKALG